MILDFCKKKEEIEHKKIVIFEAFKEFYKSKAEDVDIPYFIYARNAFNDNIKTIKDINKWHKKITQQNKNK